MLGALKHAADGEESAGERILKGFLNNKQVSELLERLQSSGDVHAGTTGDLQTDYKMVDRLVEAVTDLKNSTHSLDKWHAYRCPQTN